MLQLKILKFNPNTNYSVQCVQNSQNLSNSGTVFFFPDSEVCPKALYITASIMNI